MKKVEKEEKEKEKEKAHCLARLVDLLPVAIITYVHTVPSKSGIELFRERPHRSHLVM